MAKSEGTGVPRGPQRSLLLLLRGSGDALEAASPPFDAAAAEARLREAARARRLLRTGGIPEDDLAITDVELEEEAPPFDVEAGAARLWEAAKARKLLSGDALEDSAEQEPLLHETLRAGDSRLESRSGYVHERIPKAEVEALILEEVPDISYDDIGGLGLQIEQIKNAIELPYLHADLFREHWLEPPRGVLLYGPPGCGKTLIAKALANSLAKQVAAKTAQESGKTTGKSFFLNIQGPELLNKDVGEIERHIRLVFQLAREKASEGMPVIVFFDEMDSIFRTRGSRGSSDVENMIVAQLLSEIDEVEGLKNIIVIGASNDQDMVNPAILRPGRLDVSIRLERPDAEAARDIFSKYVLPELPLHPDDLAEHGGSAQATVDAMIQRTVERMYAESEENRFLEVTYANGDKEVLYFKDFSSGAMIENIVTRAKEMAIREFLDTGQKGMRISHLLAACVNEIEDEIEDLPNITTADDWARIISKKGESIVYIRALVSDKTGTEAASRPAPAERVSDEPTSLPTTKLETRFKAS